MTTTQQIITIGLMALGVMTTRFISFALFASEKRTPRFVHYLSRYLPNAVFGILVVYCLKDVEFTSGKDQNWMENIPLYATEAYFRDAGLGTL